MRIQKKCRTEAGKSTESVQLRYVNAYTRMFNYCRCAFALTSRRRAGFQQVARASVLKSVRKTGALQAGESIAKL